MHDDDRGPHRFIGGGGDVGNANMPATAAAVATTAPGRLGPAGRREAKRVHSGLPVAGRET